jgi:hypothetical protein
VKAISSKFTLFRCVFVCCVVTCVEGQSSVPLPRIVFDYAVSGDSNGISADVKKLDLTDCKRVPSRYNSETNVSDLAAGKVKKIRVLRTSSTFKPVKHEELQRMLLKVWLSTTLECCACGIEWDEMTFWSIDAALEFEDGKKGVLITDGTHVAMQDHDGRKLFFRIPVVRK